LIGILSALALGAATVVSGIDHESLTRIENVLRGEHLVHTLTWWTDWHYRVWTSGDHRPSYKIFQDVLGRQQTTVTFRHRNRVWQNLAEGWTLYVDKRGPALHVPNTATEEQAWAAFEAFRARLEAWVAGRGAGETQGEGEGEGEGDSRVTYGDNGSLSRYFSWEEARNPPSSVRPAARALAQNVLDPIREAVGRPVKVTSWYRSLASNRACGGASKSQHLIGEAADIRVEGMTAPQLASAILAAGVPFDQLIWYWSESGQKIPGKPSVHVSWRLNGGQRGQVLRYVKEGDYRKERPSGSSRAPAPTSARVRVDEEDVWDPWAWVSSLIFGESSVQMDAAFTLVAGGKSFDAGVVPPGVYDLMFEGRVVLSRVQVMQGNSYLVRVQGQRGSWVNLGGRG